MTAKTPLGYHDPARAAGKPAVSATDTFVPDFSPAYRARMIQAYRMRGTRHAMMVFVRRQYTIDGLALMDGTYEGIEVPVLQIHGAQDEQIPLWAAKKVQDRLSDARLHVIEGASHDIPVLYAEDVAEEISDFLNETEACSSH